MKINKCSDCGCFYIVLNKIATGGRGYFCECINCHSCGKTKLFKIGARREWNKENK